MKQHKENNVATNTFDKAGTLIPTSVGRVEVTLYDDGTNQGINYRVTVLDQNGSEMRVRNDVGNLVPHLTPTELNSLRNFIVGLREKARTEFIG